MRSHVIGRLLACLLLFACGAAQALGTFIPAPDRTDMVHDDQRGLVYIAAGSEVLRYRVADGSFLPSVVTGGALRGLDISPDGRTLAVADSTLEVGRVRVHLIDLETLAVTRLEAPAGFSESGIWTVSYAYDGALFASGRHAGSGWAPLRRFDTDGSMQVVADVRQDTMLAASGDRRVIAFAESNISDGRWGRIDAVTGEIVRRQWYEHGTSAFNYEIATSADGSQYAIPTYGGTAVYDASYARVATIGGYGDSPVGLAYHPVDSLVYFPWAGTREVRVYDTEFLEEVGSYPLAQEFINAGPAFGNARTRLSGDGSLLMVSVQGGVHILRLYAPLRAEPLTVRYPVRRRLKSFIPLRGSVGNGGDIAYEIIAQPAHGRVLLGEGRATYVPAAGYTGTETFVYRARYGRAWADAVVTVRVE